MTNVPFVFAVAESEPVGPSNVGLGAVVLTLAIAALLVWFGYIVVSSRRKSLARPEETPANLQPGVSDEELESSRLNRILTAAVISAAVLAITLPVYYVNESNRQAQAAEKFHERDVEEGAHWWEEFVCVECHGPEGGGGGAEFIERRSGITTSWAAPSLNDVFFRYSEDEVRTWIVWGRDGTPMAPAGLEGGGSMTVQEVDQVIAYLRDIQISQDEALLKIDSAVRIALDRIDNGDEVLNVLLARQQAELDDIADAAAILEVIGDFPTEVSALLEADGTCTDESARMVGGSCDVPGSDTDRDGLADDAERRLTEIAAATHAVAVTRVVNETRDDDGEQVLTVAKVPDDAFDVRFITNDPFSNVSPEGTPIPDLDAASTFIQDLGTLRLTTGVVADRRDRFESAALERLEFLEEAAAMRAWEVDYDQVLSDLQATDVEFAEPVTADDAERAVGLFNAYCARCHTAGYSAGVAFEQGAGSGAWGPALTSGRTIVQFPDPEDHVRFVIQGSEFGRNYGINGLGAGRMPGFGAVLSERDIRLIVAYERSM